MSFCRAPWLRGRFPRPISRSVPAISIRQRDRRFGEASIAYTGINPVRSSLHDIDHGGIIQIYSNCSKMTFTENLPSLVMAFQLYQDNSPTLEPDLVARNNAICPSFMPLTVEALT
jgi:hypothetical protein